MPPFDYNAPAELFLAKRTKRSRENYQRFATAAEAIRYAVETLRTAKALGRRSRSGMSASTAAKSCACTKPMIIRCASLSDRSSPRAPSRLNGSSSGGKSQEKTPIPLLSKNRSKPRGLGLTLESCTKAWSRANSNDLTS
jgi:hypothetical protein